MTRTETDALGALPLPADALYGIHTARAVENFSIANRPVRPELIHAYGAVKQACARVNAALDVLEPEMAKAIEAACEEMRDGRLDHAIRVDALQGGAGTSTNMNVNEVLANRAMQILGHPCGSYTVIDPLQHVNRHQSTNDTYPTALRIALILACRRLEQRLTALQEAFQTREHDFADIVKVGRTQLQDAVLTTLGRSMGAFAEAFSRDRWRIYKCEERLRTVNLGATAIGTGLGAPRHYIFRVTEVLAQLTGIGLARAENLVEATQNQDALVEVSGILTACAANLQKVSQDLRLMASGPEAGLGELSLPQRQCGSSIMPGKINPVIPEAAIQAAQLVQGNHVTVTQACASGNLELNAFLPLVADRLLESVAVLDGAVDALTRHCVEGMTANADTCDRQVQTSTAALTALVEPLGYATCQKLAEALCETGESLPELCERLGLMSAEAARAAISPESVNRLGSPEA